MAQREGAKTKGLIKKLSFLLLEDSFQCGFLFADDWFSFWCDVQQRKGVCPSWYFGLQESGVVCVSGCGIVFGRRRVKWAGLDNRRFFSL